VPAKRKSKLKTIVAHPMSFVLQLADLSMGQIPGRSREGAKRLREDTMLGWQRGATPVSFRRNGLPEFQRFCSAFALHVPV
jgi:hypothetical protein